MPGAAVQALALGANDFVMKPIKASDLASRVTRALEMAAAVKARPS